MSIGTLRSLRGPAALLVGGLFASLLVGCSSHYIPNTDVDDTDENRAIVSFCESYRRAVERKDIPALVEMASQDYYENGGNLDASDDIDYAGLQDYLAKKFEDAKGIRYEIRYRRVIEVDVESVEDDEDKAVIFVDYTYSGSYRVATKVGEMWRSTVEENRLELIAHGDSYRIVAGM
jgi:hypothetical protein